MHQFHALDLDQVRIVVLGFGLARLEHRELGLSSQSTVDGTLSRHRREADCRRWSRSSSMERKWAFSFRRSHPYKR